jgi:hypothetical protein
MKHRQFSSWVFLQPAIKSQNSAFGYDDCMAICDETFDRPRREDIIATHIVEGGCSDGWWRLIGRREYGEGRQHSRFLVSRRRYDFRD